MNDAGARVPAHQEFPAFVREFGKPAKIWPGLVLLSVSMLLWNYTTSCYTPSPHQDERTREYQQPSALASKLPNQASVRGAEENGDELLVIYRRCPRSPLDPEGMRTRQYASDRLPGDLWQEFHLEWSSAEQTARHWSHPYEFADNAIGLMDEPGERDLAADPPHPPATNESLSRKSFC